MIGKKHLLTNFQHHVKPLIKTYVSRALGPWLVCHQLMELRLLVTVTPDSPFQLVKFFKGSATKAGTLLYKAIT